MPPATEALELTASHIERYLRRSHGPEASVEYAGAIGLPDEQGIKRFGYGKPLLVRWRSKPEAPLEEAVFSVMRPDDYGHQFPWDRAAVLYFQYAASGRLPGHAQPLGLGYVDGAGELKPLDAPQEFFIVMEKLTGHDYHLDLARIREQGLAPGDEALARALAAWLADIHTRHDSPHLYVRRVRELLGSSECIMGLVDEAYPHPYPAYPPEKFQKLEQRLIAWRWKLRGYAHRLCVVHGDFHPWNVLADDAGNFRVLDRSRGEWGEAAGDVVCMAINYLLFGLREGPGGTLTLAKPFRALYQAFFSEYLERTGDHELLEVAAPFLVFRLLVIASPQWYPDHPEAVRRGLLTFMDNVLAAKRFDWEHPMEYFA